MVIYYKIFLNNFLLNKSPYILYRIYVRAVRRSMQYSMPLFFQKIHHYLCFVAWALSCLNIGWCFPRLELKTGIIFFFKISIYCSAFTLPLKKSIRLVPFAIKHAQTPIEHLPNFWEVSKSSGIRDSVWYLHSLILSWGPSYTTLHSSLQMMRFQKVMSNFNHFWAVSSLACCASFGI